MYLCATCRHPITNVRKLPFIGLETGTCSAKKRMVIPAWVTTCSLYETGAPTPPSNTLGVSHTHFDVMVLDNLDETKIRDALTLVPQYVSLSLIPPDDSRYEVDTSGSDWNGFVYPKKDTDNLIIIFDGVKRGFKYGGGACIWDANYHRIGISGNEPSQLVLGLRVEHEILHVIEKEYSIRTGAKIQFDADQMWTNVDFRNWLESHIRGCFNADQSGRYSPQWERLYYTYLWRKYGYENVFC